MITMSGHKTLSLQVVRSNLTFHCYHLLSFSLTPEYPEEGLTSSSIVSGLSSLSVTANSIKIFIIIATIVKAVGFTCRHSVKWNSHSVHNIYAESTDCIVHIILSVRSIYKLLPRSSLSSFVCQTAWYSYTTTYTRHCIGFIKSMNNAKVAFVSTSYHPEIPIQ